MKTLLLMITSAVVLVAGTGVIHCQSKAETLRGRLVRENGVILDQVQHRLEDKLTSLTQGWLNPGAERRQRGDELAAESQFAQQWAIRCAWVNASAMLLAALVALSLPGATRRRVFAGSPSAPPSMDVVSALAKDACGLDRRSGRRYSHC